MKIAISERDKRLLILMSTALLIVLFVRFAIMPAMERNTLLQEEVAAAEQVQAEMQMQIGALAHLDDNIQVAHSNLTQKNANFYGVMTNDELDDLVTGIILDQALGSMSMNITQAAPQPVAAYFASQQAQAQTNAQAPASEAPAAQTDAMAEDAAGPTAQLPYVAQAASTAENYVYTAIVECSVSGSRADFTKLLNSVESNYPAIRVQRFTMQDTAYLDENLAVQENSNFNLTFYVYMCDKAGDVL